MNQLFTLAQQNVTVSGAGGGILAGGMFLVFILIAIVAFAFWLWMLVDCLQSSLPSTEKLIWALVIIFANGIGALLYFFIARKGGRSIST